MCIPYTCKNFLNYCYLAICSIKTYLRDIIASIVAAISVYLLIWCLLHLLIRQNNSEMIVRPPYLVNGGFNRYAIEYDIAYFHSKDKISVAADRKERFGLHTNVTLVLSKEIEVTPAMEQLVNSSLATGLGIYELYSFSKFLYEANISVETAGNFSITVIGSDIFGNIFLDDTDNLTVNATTRYLPKTVSSDKSGYYQVDYDVPSEMKGTVTSRVSYNKIDVAKAEMNERKCTITKRENCTLDIELLDSSLAAIIILQYVISENFLVVLGLRKSLYYAVGAIPSIVIIGILVVYIIARCYKKKISNPSPETSQQTSTSQLVTN